MQHYAQNEIENTLTTTKQTFVMLEYTYMERIQLNHTFDYS